MLVSGLNLSTLGSLVITIPRSYRVSTVNGWKSVLLGNLNRFNRNRLRLKRLIPIEHDLKVINVCVRRYKFLEALDKRNATFHIVTNQMVKSKKYIHHLFDKVRSKMAAQPVSGWYFLQVTGDCFTNAESILNMHKGLTLDLIRPKQKFLGLKLN